MSYVNTIAQELMESAWVKEQTIACCAADIAAVAERLVDVLRGGGTIFFCGNGGSAGDAQHLAAELAGRYRFDRRPLAALALTANTSTLTAIGNDYGYARIFARQLAGVGRPGDALIGISTSGNSENVVEAFLQAKAAGILTVGLVGDPGGRMAALADLAVKVPSGSTPRIQEAHIAIGHILCGILEQELCGNGSHA